MKLTRFSVGSAFAVLAMSCSSPPSGFVAGDPASEQRAEELSRGHLQTVFPNHGDLRTEKVRIDHLGQAHTWVSQTVGNVPVFGGEAIVHLNTDGSLRFFTNDLVSDVRVDTTADLTASAATDLAVASHGGWATVTGTPETDLQVLRHEDATTLTYRVQIKQFEPGLDPAMPVVFIDADTGAQVWEYNNLQHADLDVAASYPNAGYTTYDAHNGTSYTAATIAQTGDTVAEDAHSRAGLTLDYYLTTFGRYSFDNPFQDDETGAATPTNGATVNSYVHYDSNYVNAYWNGSVLTYGDGDNVYSKPLVSLDVVAHEFSHAVTSNEANLIYSNESGALNEATSDIMAAAVEAAQLTPFDPGNPAHKKTVYWIGETIWLQDSSSDGRGAALRYMDDPAAAGDREHYSTRYTGTSDNGGVHTNSGIANLFFYLLAEGGVHPNSAFAGAPLAGIGIQNAASIWYLALSNYMTSSSDFADARWATVFAAQDLDTSNQGWANAVHAAWDAVGVAKPAEPARPPNYQRVQTIDTGTLVEGSQTVFGPFNSDGYEAVKFVMSGTTGDADLYVRLNKEPSTRRYDCRSAASGSAESCEFDPAQSGQYYVMIHAWAQGPTHPGDVTDGTLRFWGASAEAECASDSECTAGGECQVGSCSSGSCSYSDVAEDTTCSGGICCGGSCAAATCDDAADCTDGTSCETAACTDGGTCGASCDYTPIPECTADPFCGDGTCDAGEDCNNCGADCAGKLNGKPSGRYCCGDGSAHSEEGNGDICDGNY